ncbi:MAG: hypothetical protein RI947_1453 [Candidatus Parcubacteria bacterium]|jgi:hypothetical protein
MASIENHQTAQVNMVIIPNIPLDIYALDTTKIKTKIADIFSDSKPVITQFPEIVVIFEPNNQISVNVIKDDNKIIIADNKITPYTSRDTATFLKFAKEASDIILGGSQAKQFGINILSVLDISGDSIKSGEIIRDKFINISNFNEKLGGTIEGAGIKVVYKKDTIRYDLMMEPRFGTDLIPTKSININLNAHLNGDIPDLTRLTSLGQEIYNNLASTVTLLLA